VIAPYGSWRSPLAPERLAGATLRLGACTFAPDGALYWVEGRPAEGGRGVLVRRTPAGRIEDVTPAPWNVRSRVHEYGGRAYVVGPDAVYFVHDGDGRLHRLGLAPGDAPAALSPDDRRWRFAEPILDERRRRLVCVAERHDEGAREPENLLVSVPIDGGPVTALARGRDFYAAPALSPDGRRLAFLAWDHPHMPWDAAAVHVADVDGHGALVDLRHVAGSPTASAFQPGFAPDGTLLFGLEAEGRWNLHRLADGRVERLHASEGESGLPLWGLGTTTWALLGEDAIAIASFEGGRARLERFDLGTGESREIAYGGTAIAHLDARAGRLALVAGWEDRPSAIAIGTAAGGDFEIVRSAAAIELPAALVSSPEAISYPTSGGEIAHAFFYPPRNPRFVPPPDERPPLVVVVHGGPTGATSPTLSLAVQFWTTRGIAVLDVNYRGSTGYGRAYRDRLKGQWGIVDVEDCVAGARHLAAQGRVDGRRLAIRGSSAGGFTALAALTFHDAFAAGASLYGVSDLEALVRETHKFEAHYTQALVAPYPAGREVYTARSPLHQVDRLRRPVIVLQGLEDKVVPPRQAEALVEALRAKGIATEYHAFPGEQHGFRRAETIRRALEAELAFYGRVFGFSPS
jgi:dipeptidyl aminopeptidase/acylaminoacyl peptidase